MEKGLAALAALIVAAAVGGLLNAAGADDAQLAKTAYEARQAIAVIEWFYVRHRACPIALRPAEMALLRDRLGDGYSAEPQGAFVEIRGISMVESWRYYASPSHRETCTLLRSLGGDATLVWRFQRGLGRWTLDPGEGRPERPIKPRR